MPPERQTSRANAAAEIHPAYRHGDAPTRVTFEKFMDRKNELEGAPTRINTTNLRKSASSSGTAGSRLQHGRPQRPGIQTAGNQPQVGHTQSTTQQQMPAQGGGMGYGGMGMNRGYGGGYGGMGMMGMGYGMGMMGMGMGNGQGPMAWLSSLNYFVYAIGQFMTLMDMNANNIMRTYYTVRDTLTNAIHVIKHSSVRRWLQRKSKKSVILRWVFIFGSMILVHQVYRLVRFIMNLHKIQNAQRVLTDQSRLPR